MSQKYVQNASQAGAPPPPHWGAYDAPPDPYSAGEGTPLPRHHPTQRLNSRAFGSRHSAPSALALRASSLFTAFRCP